MATRAAVVREPNTLDVVEVEVAAPAPHEVSVEIAAVGVCHTDLSMLAGSLGLPLPAVLGHEGSGVVTAVGDDVASVRPGDRVVLCCLAPCGSCFHCVRDEYSLCEVAGRAMAEGTLLDGTTRVTARGVPVHQAAGLGAFADRCVVPAAAVVPLPDAVSFEHGALMGCGVLTGFGAVLNAGEVRPGESVVVLGCGGVGLSAIQGARVSGAAVIIAVDPRPERRRLATIVGASHALEPGADLVPAVRDLTSGRGADAVIEAAGVQDTVEIALRLTRAGGRLVLVGAGSTQVRLSVPAFLGLVHPEKSVRGSLYGSGHPRRTIETMLACHARGDLVLDDFVTHRFGLAEIASALDYARRAEGARAVVVP